MKLVTLKINPDIASRGFVLKWDKEQFVLVNYADASYIPCWYQKRAILPGMCGYCYK